MLRLSKTLRAAIAVAAFLASTASLGQSGLGGRITDAGTKLDQDVQGCRPINLGEYVELLHEAALNKQRAAKAAKKGVPVDQAQVDADLANASALFNRAQAALVQQCLRQAAQQPKETSLRLSQFAEGVLLAHNAERAAVGAPPLRWNPALEQDATAWAQQLAQAGHLAHAPREGRGTERENLNQGMPGWGVNQMMANWLKEKPNFKAGTFPDVSTTGNWVDVSHYTQMIWPTTTDLGCGMTTGSGFSWLVCRYDPGGNKDGKMVGQPPVLAGDTRGDIAPDTSTTLTNPKPPPPPTASDEAPGGNEDNHPLVGYGAEAFIRHSAAVDCGNTAAAEAELSKLRYALDQLRKRLKAAKKAGNFSTVKPDDVQRQINLLESFLRAAEQRKPREACPPPPPPPPPPSSK